MYSTKTTSVLPKVISGVLAAVLLLPILIFTALPNTVFGYSSATDQGVAGFTASAQRLSGAYRALNTKSNRRWSGWSTASSPASQTMTTTG